MFLVLIRSENESGGTALQYNWDQPLDHSDHSSINVALNQEDDRAGLCNTEKPASLFWEEQNRTRENDKGINSTLAPTSVTLVSLTRYT